MNISLGIFHLNISNFSNISKEYLKAVEYFYWIFKWFILYCDPSEPQYFAVNLPWIFLYTSDDKEPSPDKAKYTRSDSTNYDTDETVAYLSSDGSSSGKSEQTSEHSSDSFDSSDDELLIKYKKEDTTPHEEDTPSQGLPTEEPSTLRKRGHPKRPAKAPKRDFNRLCSISQHNVCRDRIDEECECLGIYYQCWQPMNPDQTSHISVRDFSDNTEVPEEQQMGSWCLLCPMNCYMTTQHLTLKHYRAVHHKKMLVVRDMKMWRCKCSEVRSHGSDNSAQKAHYHCFICYHHFKSSDLIAIHFATQHPELTLGKIRHLMDPSNPHQRSF